MDASRCYQIERNVLRWEKWIRKPHTIPDNKWYLFIKSNIEAIEKKIEIKSAFPVKHVSFQTFLLGNLKKKKKRRRTEQNCDTLPFCHVRCAWRPMTWQNYNIGSNQSIKIYFFLMTSMFTFLLYCDT